MTDKIASVYCTQYDVLKNPYTSGQLNLASIEKKIAVFLKEDVVTFTKHLVCTPLECMPRPFHGIDFLPISCQSKERLSVLSCLIVFCGITNKGKKDV